MVEPMGCWRRTHTCGNLQARDAGREVLLMGWVARRRDHGGVIFVDLRDRYGITQVVFNPVINAEVHRHAEEIRSEYVIAVRGVVEKRPSGMENPKLATGMIEVVCHDLKILNDSRTPPFPLDAENVEINEETRLKYRYLDLRRTAMQRNLLLRHHAYQVTRRFLTDQGFVEIETPFLMKSTPEGARDYLVPSRVNKGKFYALPQSPQTYKQILMVAGFDRYFQIVRCFRDEDLRGDRQPEFTQIDIEMSFAGEDDVMDTAERLTASIFRETLSLDLHLPAPRLTYDEAIARYGSDKPDTRFDLELIDIGDLAGRCNFEVFRGVLRTGGRVKGINVKKCASFSRKEIDDLEAFVGRFGARGLSWMKVTEEGLQSSIVKFFPEEVRSALAVRMDAEPDDLLLFVADTPQVVTSALGNLRLELGRKLGLMQEGKWNLLWVTRFPLLEYDEEERRYVAAHHPFTSPVEEDIERMESDPASLRARAYDLVLNGWEIAGGSIRIHQRSVQNRMFALLGISEEEAREKFGFLLDAFEYGAPPHGGIAFGFDRLIALLAGERFIRDVIAFPKTNNALSLMDGSPSEVTKTQLHELGLRLVSSATST